MAERDPQQTPREEKPDEEGDLGHPSQTGPGSGEGMGTEEGSGWEPDEDSGEDIKVDPEAPPPVQHPR